MPEGQENMDMQTIANEAITYNPDAPIVNLSSHHFETDTLKRKEKHEIDLSDYKPIATSEEVIAETGLNLGELVAIVQLPYKDTMVGLEISPTDWSARIDPLKVYCFKQNAEDNAQHSLPSYVMIGDPQIRQMQQGKELPKESFLTIDSIGEAKKFGRETWMPDVGPNIPKVADSETYDPFYKRNATVSRDHGSFAMGDKGQLVVRLGESPLVNDTAIIRGNPKPQAF